jgi:hypothetical protein
MEAVWPGLRADFDLHCFYERMKRRKGANSAKVATARRMLSYSLFGIPDFRFYAPGDGIKTHLFGQREAFRAIFRP